MPKIPLPLSQQKRPFSQEYAFLGPHSSQIEINNGIINLARHILFLKKLNGKTYGEFS